MIDVVQGKESDGSLGAGRAGGWRSIGLAYLRRALAALRATQRRRADHDVARLIARSGGCLTDQVERTITRRHQPLAAWAVEPTPADVDSEPQSKEKSECRKRSWSSIAMPWF